MVTSFYSAKSHSMEDRRHKKSAFEIRCVNTVFSDLPPRRVLAPKDPRTHPLIVHELMSEDFVPSSSQRRARVAAEPPALRDSILNNFFDRNNIKGGFVPAQRQDWPDLRRSTFRTASC